VWVRLDVGKEEHFAEVLDNDGERIFARSVVNDQAALEALLDRASEHGTVGLVIDQPGSIAQLLALAVARHRLVPVAYVPGLVMRRAADLYPGEAKTDKRDAFIIADTGRTRRKQVHWLGVGSDELLDRLRVLNGFDIDLAADQTRLAKPVPGRPDQRVTGPGTSPRSSPAAGRGAGPAGQVPDAHSKQPVGPGSPGSSRPARLASPRRSSTP
jgi:Transposase